MQCSRRLSACLFRHLGSGQDSFDMACCPAFTAMSTRAASAGLHPARLGLLSHVYVQPGGDKSFVLGMLGLLGILRQTSSSLKT